MFEDTFRGWCDLVLPGTSYLERDGTTVNLEGRLQRQRRAVIAPVPGRARVDREARRALRRRALAARVDRLRRDLRRAATAASRSATSPSRRRCRSASSRAEPLPNPRRREAGGRRGAAARHLPAAVLRGGGGAHARARVPCGRPARSTSRPTTPRARDRRRRHRHGQLERHVARAARTDRARPAPGLARIPRDDAAGLHEHRRGERSDARARALVDLADQVRRDDQPRHGRVRLHDVARAQGARPDAAPLRPEPRRPVRPAAADRRPDQARAQGGVLPGLVARDPVHRRADHLVRDRARRVRRHPLGHRLDDPRLLHPRRARERADLADPDLRARLDRHLRLHRRRLGLRLEVLDPRLDAHVRSARLLRGLARAVACSASC